MAAASFSLTAVVQDVFQLTETTQQQRSALGTPVNANQAQGAPAPADTVTLTNQAAQGQQAGQDRNAGHFDRAAFLGTGLFIGANNTEANRQPLAPTLPVLLPPLQTQDAPAAGAATNAADPIANDPNAAANAEANAAAAANAADGAATTTPMANTPQQELQQLDQTLQQLGINPQSISIFNRMAMLLYAGDPAALRQLVQMLQASQTGQVATPSAAQAAASAGNNAAQAAVQDLLPSAAQSNSVRPFSAATQTPATTHPAPQIEVLAAQVNFIDVQATLQSPPSPNAPNQVSATSSPVPSDARSFQIEGLQIAFQAVEILPGQSKVSGSASANATGNALNVTA